MAGADVRLYRWMVTAGLPWGSGMNVTSAAASSVAAFRSGAELFAPIARDLEAAERIFRQTLATAQPGVGRLVEHLAHYRGKRLRPALLLLTAKACGGCSTRYSTPTISP